MMKKTKEPKEPKNSKEPKAPKEKKIPTMLILLGVSCAIFTGASFAGSSRAYHAYALELDIAKEPALSMLFRGLHDGVLPWDAEEDTAALEESGEESAFFHISDPAVKETKKEKEEEDAVSIAMVEESQEITWGEAPEGYFSDALFVGDSRTDGLAMYSTLRREADFASKTSLSVFQLFEWKLFYRTPEKGDKEDILLLDLLKRKQYKKIYLSIGINELGSNPNSYIDTFSEAVDTVRSLQPDAIIYVESIMRVTKAKSSRDAHINNTNIDERNEMLKGLADDQTIFYIDMNESVCDDSGNLKPELTNDGVHLKASEYEIWVDFLRSHAVFTETVYRKR